MTLLLRPSPAIRSPPEDTLKLCYQSAVRSIRLYDELYRDDLLVHSWATVHSVFLATITMLYCIWVVPDVPNETKLDVLIADLKTSSNVLSATGIGLKRSAAEKFWTTCPGPQSAGSSSQEHVTLPPIIEVRTMKGQQDQCITENLETL